MSEETKGYILGFLGVLAFSVTLPATRHAVQWLDPVMVGLGRAVVAAGLAGLFLAAMRQPRPRGRDLGGLAIVALGVVVGFPVLSAWAMQSVPSAHGGVVLGLLPLATAAAGAGLAGERPAPGFWVFASIGSMLVIAFSLWGGGWSLQWGDLALLAAVAVAALGYAEGGRLARRLGGWQVISWALVLSLPALLPIVLLRMPESLSAIPVSGWAAFAYLAVVSQFLGFFFWYRGLALGGIAKVGQIQLFQIFLTLFFAWLLVGETIEAVTIAFALGVFVCVALGRRMPVKRR